MVLMAVTIGTGKVLHGSTKSVHQQVASSSSPLHPATTGCPAPDPSPSWLHLRSRLPHHAPQATGPPPPSALGVRLVCQPRCCNIRLALNQKQQPFPSQAVCVWHSDIRCCSNVLWVV